MAVAKRRQSKSRKNMRRAQWMKVDPPALSKCPHCGEFRLDHRVCKSCGKYGKADEARQVVIKKEKAKSPESKSA